MAHGRDLSVLVALDLVVSDLVDYLHQSFCVLVDHAMDLVTWFRHVSGTRLKLDPTSRVRVGGRRKDWVEFMMG